MGHTYASLHYHIIFSTKNRTNSISSEYKESLFAFISTIINNEFGFTRKINGVSDHIHICADIKTKYSIADVLKKIKSKSSFWVNDNFDIKTKFVWQEGYSAFSVSKSTVPKVVKYIVNQEKHHRNITYKEEVISFLKKHEINYDDKYLWN